MRRPRAAQDDVVQAVEKVGRVARVHGHGLEAFVGGQGRGRPLPDAAEAGLACETVAVGSHGRGVPVLEAGGGRGEIDKEGSVDVGTGGEVGGGGWRRGRFLDAVVDEMTAIVRIDLIR